jgi:hypothetical protein
VPRRFYRPNSRGLLIGLLNGDITSTDELLRATDRDVLVLLYMWRDALEEVQATPDADKKRRLADALGLIGAALTELGAA